MNTLLLLIAFVTAPFLPPRAASHVAAHLIGAPWVAEHLERTCHRESRCKGHLRDHARDSWAGRSMHRIAVRVGWLDPETCPFHKLEAGYWAPADAWGSSRAYTLHHLRLGCVPSEVLHIPLLGAIASGRRMVGACSTPPCTREEIRAVWKGRRNTKKAAERAATKEETL